MPVEFTDNSIKVKDRLDSAMVSFLYEACGELEAQLITASKRKLPI